MFTHSIFIIAVCHCRVIVVIVVWWSVVLSGLVPYWLGLVPPSGRNYPMGLGIAVGMVFLSCFIPVLVGTGISPDPYSEWSDGYFVRLAGTID